MFGKKKNTEAPKASTMSKQQSSSAPSIQGQSLFASEINPPLPQIDFGFQQSYQEPLHSHEQYQHAEPEMPSAPPESFHEVAASMAPPAFESAPSQTWEPSSEPAAQEWTLPEEPASTETFEPAWEMPTEFAAQPEAPPAWQPALEPAADSSWTMPETAFESPSTEAAFTGTDAFSAPSSEDWLSPPPEPSAFSTTAESPVNLDESAFAAPEFSPASDYDLPFTETPPEPAIDPYATSFEPYEDALTDSAPADSNALWDNLSTPQEADWSGGSQVPVSAEASGHFLDSVTDQLYPAGDEFLSTEELLATEQAFAEAANFLFPETATAELDWTTADDVVNVSATPMQPPMDEMAGWEPTPAEPVGDMFFTEPALLDPQPAAPDFFQTPEPMTAPEPVAFEADLSPPPFSQPEPPVSPEPFAPTAAVDDRSWDTDWDFASEASEPAAPGLQFVSVPKEDEDVFPSLNSDQETTLGEDAEEWDLTTGFEDDAAEEPRVKGGDWGDIEWGAPEDINTFSLGGNENLQPAAPGFGIAQSPQPSAAEDLSSELFPSFSMEDLTPASNTEQPLADPLSFEPAADETWPNWSEPAASAPVPPVAAPTAIPDISQWDSEKIQVLASFPIERDKGLLLVQYENLFALMGQTGGPESSQVSVIKTFPHNPLNDADIFGAQKEGESAGKQMYLTQIGNWQAIISADNQSILLHTELS